MIIPKIKILKPGASENSTDIRDYRFHSNFSFLKGYLDTTESMTINAGDTTKQIIIPHGLTYAPEVDVFHDVGSGLVQLPYRLKTISGYDKHFYCSVDDTNVYINWKSAISYNQLKYYVSEYYNEATSSYASVRVGKDASNYVRNSAMKFDGIEILDGSEIQSAYISFYVSAKGGGNSNVKMVTYGMDQNNVSSFFDDYPMDSERTSASTSQEQAMVSTPFGFDINITDQLKEITNRGAWASGNNTGFLLLDNGSSTDCTVFDNTFGSYLNIIKTGSVTHNFRIFINKDKIA